MNNKSRQSYKDLRVLEMARERVMFEKGQLDNVDLSIRDERGRNTLYWAIKNRNRHNVKMLLKHDIDLMVEKNLHALVHAIASKDMEVFIHLFNTIDADVNLKDHEGRTLLMKAVEYEAIPFVRYIMQQGATLKLRDKYNKNIVDYIKNCKNQDIFNLIHYRILNEKMRQAV